MIDAQKTNSTEPLVSIIVPVYKVEKYLDRCVQSIVSQTYKNIEVFLVDDGSPDNCGKMCDEYAEKYPYIHVIHQENQGPSAARNNAVPHTNGAYITFIDSDDYVTSDYLEYLVSLQQKFNADVAIGGHKYLYENSKLKNKQVEDVTVCLTSAEALSRMNYGKGFSVFAWGKLYKRELIERHPYPGGGIIRGFSDNPQNHWGFQCSRIWK